MVGTWLVDRPSAPSTPSSPQAPLFWGGDIQVRVTAVVKAGSKLIDVPVDVANVQVRAREMR